MHRAENHNNISTAVRKQTFNRCNVENIFFLFFSVEFDLHSDNAKSLNRQVNVTSDSGDYELNMLCVMAPGIV